MHNIFSMRQTNMGEETSVQSPLAAKYTNFSIENLLRLVQPIPGENRLGPEAVDVLRGEASQNGDPIRALAAGFSAHQDRKTGTISPSRQTPIVSCVALPRNKVEVTEGKMAAQPMMGMHVEEGFVLKHLFFCFLGYILEPAK